MSGRRIGTLRGQLAAMTLLSERLLTIFKIPAKPNQWPLLGSFLFLGSCLWSTQRVPSRFYFSRSPPINLPGFEPREPTGVVQQASDVEPNSEEF